MNLTVDDIANEIRQTRETFLGTIMIAEGGTDSRLYKQLVDQDLCRIIPSYGKEKAIDILDILERENFDGVLAVVDADFWRLEGKEPTSPNLFVTDTHDLETMILKSRALGDLLDKFGSSKKIADFTKLLGKCIRRILLDLALPIGYLRWISQRDNLSLDFKCRDGKGKDNRHKVFTSFFKYKTMTLCVSKMIATFIRRSEKNELSEEELEKSIDEMMADADHNPWDVCCGHDLVCILSRGLRKKLGTNNSNEVLPKLIEELLRGYYSMPHFSATQLYVSLKHWERDNHPFRIFPVY